MLVMMVAPAVRGVDAARMRNRIASYCIWGRRETIVHELGHARHLYEEPSIYRVPCIRRPLYMGVTYIG